MKPFSTLWNLIRRGILRIFPLPRLVLYLFVAAVVCTLIGCATPKQVTQLVRDTRVDTLYLSNVKYDSIYVYQERFQDRSRDTLYIKDKSIEYRYKLLRDTVRVIHRDSIPYEVTITEVKEITRPLNWYDKLLRIVFWLNIGFALYWLYRILRYFKIIKI